MASATIPPTLLGEREEDCHQVSTAYPWRQNALASVEGVLAAGCHEPADVLAIDSFPFFFSLPRCRNDGQPFSRVISVLISTPTGTALGVYQKDYRESRKIKFKKTALEESAGYLCTSKRSMVTWHCGRIRLETGERLFAAVRSLQWFCPHMRGLFSLRSHIYIN